MDSEYFNGVYRMKKSQNSPKKDGNKYFNNDKEISKTTYYRLMDEIKKSQKNGKSPKNSQKEKPTPRKTKLINEKELIDYKALSKYIGISQLAEMYRKHFGNKVIRVTDRLQRYINQPKDMIRMSLILKNNGGN